MEQNQEKWQLYIVIKTIFQMKDEHEMQGHSQRPKHNFWVKCFLCEILISVVMVLVL